MTTLTTVPGLENIIYIQHGYYTLECEVVEEREKAVKLSVQAYLAYPGTNDTTGSNLGFTWVAKSALKQYKSSVPGIDNKYAIGTYTVANWCKLEYRKR